MRCSHWIKGPASPRDETLTSKSTMPNTSRSEMGVGVIGRGESLRSASPTAMYNVPAAGTSREGSQSSELLQHEGGAPIFDDQYFMELLEANNPQMKNGSTIVTI